MKFIEAVQDSHTCLYCRNLHGMEVDLSDEDYIPPFEQCTNTEEDADEDEPGECRCKITTKEIEK